MRAGSAKERVRIERPTNTRTELGGYEASETIIERAWADIRPIKDTEFPQGDQMRAHATHRIFIRWRSLKIRHGDRIVSDDATYYVESAINVMHRNRHFEILAKEIIDG